MHASWAHWAVLALADWLPCLQHNGVSGYILDLRDNPGGLGQSGIDIARLLLDGHPTVFAITGRQGEPVQQVRIRVAPLLGQAAGWLHCTDKQQQHILHTWCFAVCCLAVAVPLMLASHQVMCGSG